MKIFVAIFLLSICALSYAQTDSPIATKPATERVRTINPVKKDTTKLADTTSIKQDSSLITKTDSTKLRDSVAAVKKDTTIYKLLLDFPLLNNSKPDYMVTSFRDVKSKDMLFYLLIFIVFLLSLIQVLFSKYFRNIFNIFFQTSFRQKQTREKLTQENIAALLLNILFIISASTFVTLISSRFKITHTSFWQIFAFALIALTVVYLVKLLFTQFMGWVFNKKEIAQSYSFIVFIINKIIGVALIPFLFLLAFSTNGLQQLAFTTVIMLIIFLFLFRFFNTYKNLSGRLKINAIHFFLYFCSVEILPLLIMYKALNNYLSNGI